MWIFLKDSFLSIVAYPEDELLLMVRARAEGDIENVFGPGYKVEKSDGTTDYSFRALIPRYVVAGTMSSVAQSITATNFKDSVIEPDRNIAYQRVWAVMNDFQTERGAPGKYGKLGKLDREIEMLTDPAYDDYLRPGRRRRSPK